MNNYPAVLWLNLQFKHGKFNDLWKSWSSRKKKQKRKRRTFRENMYIFQSLTSQWNIEIFSFRFCERGEVEKKLVSSWMVSNFQSLNLWPNKTCVCLDGPHDRLNAGSAQLIVTLTERERGHTRTHTHTPAVMCMCEENPSVLPLAQEGVLKCVLCSLITETSERASQWVNQLASQLSSL